MAAIYKQISEIPNYQTIRKIECVNHKIQSFDGIEKCQNITFINLNKNQIEQFGNNLGKNLGNLVVLNVGNNKLKKIEGLEKLTKLKALVLNNNQLTKISGLENQRELNTLIISYNMIKDINSVNSYRSLLKLNISHNQITSLNGVEKLKELKELKANDNQITEIPKKINALQKLSILDLGKNKFRDIKQLKPLNGLKKLVNFNFLGNEFELSVEDLQSKLNLGLKLFNNKKIEDGMLHGDDFYKKLKLNKQVSKGVIEADEVEKQMEEYKKEKQEKKKEKQQKLKQKNFIPDSKKRNNSEYENITKQQKLNNGQSNKFAEEETELEKKNIASFDLQHKQKKGEAPQQQSTKIGIQRIEKNNASNNNKQKGQKNNNNNQNKPKPVKANIFEQQSSNKTVSAWD